MSQARALYSTLAATAITFARESGSSVTVTAKDLHQLPNAVQAADAPARLLLPYSVTTKADGQFLTVDTILAATWVITDLLLWKPGTLGAGIADSAADLVRYQAAYLEAMRSLASMGGLAGVEVLSIELRPGLYDWPIGSNTWWQGVMASITVLEELSS